MINESKNKMMAGEPPEIKTKTKTQSWHFAGGGEYEPIAIEASTYEEALAKWEQQRRKVELSQKIESAS